MERKISLDLQLFARSKKAYRDDKAKTSDSLESKVGNVDSSVRSDAPEINVQTDQSLGDALKDAAITPLAKESKYDKKHVTIGSSTIQHSAAARVVTLSAASGAIPGTVLTGRSLEYSGNVGQITGSMATTPIVGQGTRAPDRFGKKIESITKHLDFIPSEQIVVDSSGVKPLVEQKDEVQGGDNTIRNENVLSQKTAGAVPGSLNFQRSLDDISYDMFYYGRGQTNKLYGMNYNDSPTLTKFVRPYAGFEAQTTPAYDKSGAEVNIADLTNYAPYYVETALVRGNFLPKMLHVHATDGVIDKFYFDVETLRSRIYDENTLQRSASHELMHVNRCEQVREVIDAEAGDEISSKYWSPLARAVAQPSQTLCFLDDLEAMTGNEIFLSYKKAQTSLAFQINETAKNGMKPARNMRQALLGCIVPEHGSTVYEDDGVGDPFTTNWYKLGAASLLIGMSDATRKYTSLGKMMSLPLGPKSLIEVAENNMDVFRMDADYAKLVNNMELFSTFEHEYDSVSSVYITDKAANIQPYDWNVLFSFGSADTTGSITNLNYPEFSYEYTGLRTKTVVTTSFPLLKGLYLYLESKMPALTDSRVLGKTFDLQIPVVHSTKYLSTWSFLICAATKYMQYVRTNSLSDVLAIQSNYTYPFKELVTLKEADPLHSANYGMVDGQAPLTPKQMTPNMQLLTAWPEVFAPVGEDGSVEMTMLPWYANENNFNVVTYNIDPTKTTWERSEDNASMSYPTTRSGIRSAAFDLIYAQSERNTRLSFDRIVDFGANGTGFMVYKYDRSGDGIPCVDMHDLNWSIGDYLSLPRELGLFVVAPAGTLTPLYFGHEDTIEAKSHALKAILSQKTVTAADLEDFYLTEFTSNRIYPGFRMNYFFSAQNEVNDAPYKNAILDEDEVNISRASAFAQDWNTYPSIPEYSAITNDPGFRMSIGECFNPNGSLRENVSIFTPFTGGADFGSVVNDNMQLFTLQKGLWTRMQRMSVAISPWDVASAAKAALVQDAAKFDIFDFDYMLGLQGFRASNYLEDIYNRNHDVMTLGMNYVRDRFLDATPLLK